MAWQNPKTDWKAGDIPTASDFNRIEDNIQELENTKETPAGAQAKANAAAGVVRAELNTHKADGASHSKTARFVIGTSTAGWTTADCDYLCDGTNDQSEIIQALNALPATGGEVVILDGTYNITAKINVNKDNVSIKGNGNDTILKRMWNSSSVEGVITLTSVEGCRVQNLQIDGNKATYISSYNYGISLYSSSNNTITGNTCNNNSGSIYLNSSSNNTVTGNTCNNNNNGIYLNSSSNNTVTGNTCNSNNNGIYLTSSSNSNTITGNTCNDNNNGIHLTSSSNNTVTGNTCNNNNSCGICLALSSNNTVTGNTCIRGTGQTSDYASYQYTIQLQGTANNYNLISSNNCMGKAVAISGGTGNTLVNNKWDASDDIQKHLSDVVTDADGAHGLKIESGTFTPVLRGSSVAGVNTYSIQFGTYYKIGDLVFIDMGIRLTAKDESMAGYLTITGLPFNGTASSINIGRHRYIAYDGILKGRVEGVSILLDVCKPNTVSNNLMAGAIANNSDIFISAVYKI